MVSREYGKTTNITRRGIDRNLWVWEQPNYTKDYIVVADVSRGDGSDFSTYQVLKLKIWNKCANIKDN